ncbi:hypothetical protein PPL_08349 [Heterostelium album PN500]|uniref:Uncharacterized protein n=1 Tax=Heterostelium pallidum (strain ATCC 26659 / Pp 5 / PN500) TaxID=670386 RepID=D3BHY1_HETP5|nr:hypothetical protein PPL_08349 [Heterostelium album PN500]EFA78881.1 hypothetical protein PPL_08349 [Heterostelium album PN500]|eukprot:XP_020431005.1 hypothetical protein PPL_08349 [Heterostelium album PN500]
MKKLKISGVNVIRVVFFILFDLWLQARACFVFFLVATLSLNLDSALAAFPPDVNFNNNEWNPTLLTQFIQYSHDRGLAVHNMLSLNCTAINCYTFFSTGQYISSVTLLTQVGGDGLHLDIEQFGSSWANTSFQYLKSVNNKYVASMAVGC